MAGNLGNLRVWQSRMLRDNVRMVTLSVQDEG
jgi:hypothetical protein